MNQDELTNRAFGALSRNVKLTYPGQERNEIVFWFSDDTLFGLVKGSRNFEVKINRDIENSNEYLQLTIMLLNDKSIVHKRCHTSYIIPRLKRNKNFSVSSLYTRGILGHDQDFVYNSL